MVYAQPGKAREHRWPVERLRQPETFSGQDDPITALLQEPAVALLAAESQVGGIWVGSAKGEARLCIRGGEVIYEAFSGDPLELGGYWQGSFRDSLETTWNSRFPDAAFQLMDQFRSRRSGDLLVVANKGYDFRGRYEVPEHKAGHGSLIRAHMQTPVWSSHPVPAKPLRTVDLFPTMLSWLGVPVPPGIDGEPVWILDGPRRVMPRSTRPPAYLGTAPEMHRA